MIDYDAVLDQIQELVNTKYIDEDGRITLTYFLIFLVTA